jgi:hypothetical protein
VEGTTAVVAAVVDNDAEALPDKIPPPLDVETDETLLPVDRFVDKSKSPLREAALDLAPVGTGGAGGLVSLLRF